MARLNKFASVNFNDSYGKADQSHGGGAPSGSKGGSASSTRSRISSHSGGMLILTRPKQLPSSSGKLGSPSPVNLPSLRREGSETLATSPPVAGWSTKEENSTASSTSSSHNPGINRAHDINPNPNTTANASSSLDSKRIGDVVLEQAKPLFKPDVYAPPAVRAIMKNASGSTAPPISPSMEKQAVAAASNYIREEEFPALQASRPLTPPGPLANSLTEKNLKQKQNLNKDLGDAVEQLPPQKSLAKNHHHPDEKKPLQQPLLPSLPLQSAPGTQGRANKQDVSKKEHDLSTSSFGHQLDKQTLCGVDGEAGVVPPNNGQSQEPKEVVHSFRPQYRARVPAPQVISSDMVAPVSVSSAESLPKGNSENLKLADDYRTMPSSKVSEDRSGFLGKGNYLDKEHWLLRDVVGFGREGSQSEVSEHISGSSVKDVKDSLLYRDVGLERESYPKDLEKEIKDSIISRDAGSGRESYPKEESEHRSGSSWKDTKGLAFSRDAGFQKRSPSSERLEHRTRSFGRDNEFERKSSPSEWQEQRGASFGKDVKESSLPRDGGFRRQSPPNEVREHRISSFGEGNFLTQDLHDSTPTERMEHGSGSLGRVIKDSSLSMDVGSRREGLSSEWSKHRNESFGKGSNLNKDLRDSGFGREGHRNGGPELRSSLNRNSSISRKATNGKEDAYVEHDEGNKDDSSGRRSFRRTTFMTQNSPRLYGQTSYSNGGHNDSRGYVNDWEIKHVQDRDSTSWKDKRNTGEITAGVHRKGGRDVEEYNPGIHRKDRRDVEQYSARDFKEIHDRNAVDIYDQNIRTDQMEVHGNTLIKDGGRTDLCHNRDGIFHNSRPYSPGQGQDSPYIRRYNSYGSREHTIPKDKNFGSNSLGRWSPGIDADGSRSNPHSETIDSWRGRDNSHDSVREYTPHTEKIPKGLEEGQQAKAKTLADETRGSYHNNERSVHKGEASLGISGKAMLTDVPDKKHNDEQSVSVDVRAQVIQEEERRKEAARLKLLELEERIAQRPSEERRKEGESNSVGADKTRTMNIVAASGQEDMISTKPEVKEPLSNNERSVISKEDRNFALRVSEKSFDEDRKTVRSRSPVTSSWRKEAGNGPRSKLFSSPYIESGGGFRRPTTDGGTYKLF